MSRFFPRAFALVVALAAMTCGPVPPPKDAYQSAPDLLADLVERRSKVRTFRISGRVDHFGEEHRIQGKTFLFARLPDQLRIELLSPFMSPLTVLTVNNGKFAMNDLREGRYMTGPAEPCNIARLLRIPLPPADIFRILIGLSPLIDGENESSWNSRAGHYEIVIKNQDQTQYLKVGPSRETLPLLSSRLEDAQGTIFDIDYSHWSQVAGIPMPHEIRVKMPRSKTDLLLRYDDNGVEINIVLPEDAWTQSPPAGLTIEEVECN
jgi:uncharacterized protein DUF4292